MNQPFYYFDQLFDKLPNGLFRERNKPAPLDPNRNLYSKDRQTGRFIVLWYIPLRPDFRERDPTFKIDPLEWFAGVQPLLGGNWGSCPPCYRCRFPMGPELVCRQCGARQEETGLL